METAEQAVVLSAGPYEERRALTAVHRLFRYPAKFHGPLARSLLLNYTEPGCHIIDPFCGSGTLTIEGQLIDRQVDGADIDPLAVFVAGAKVASHDVNQLRVKYKVIADLLAAKRRTRQEYEQLQFEDISESLFGLELRGLTAPQIPNIEHWFRRYVIVDLARIRDVLDREIDDSEKEFFSLCFGAIIRLSSNADPVPVSGLEVTSHMLKRDAAGRVVDPYQLYDQAVRRALKAMEQYQNLFRYNDASIRMTKFYNIDSTRELRSLGTYDAVVTSPPYHGAVDYYRRHTLEMYWLGLVQTAGDRLALRPSYIGRLGVAARDCSEDSIVSAYGQKLHERMLAAPRSNKKTKSRAISLLHYCQGMHRFFVQLSDVLPRSGSKAVLVVGDSRWNGEFISTALLLTELARPHFDLTEVKSHKIKNHYMSYSRHNAASIDTEQVLVFERL